MTTHRLEMYSRRSIKVPATLHKSCKCTIPVVSRRLRVWRRERQFQNGSRVVQPPRLFRRTTKEVYGCDAVASEDRDPVFRNGARRGTTTSDAIDGVCVLTLRRASLPAEAAAQSRRAVWTSSILPFSWSSPWGRD